MAAKALMPIGIMVVAMGSMGALTGVVHKRRELHEHSLNWELALVQHAGIIPPRTKIDPWIAPMDPILKDRKIPIYSAHGALLDQIVPGGVLDPYANPRPTPEQVAEERARLIAYKKANPSLFGPSIFSKEFWMPAKKKVPSPAKAKKEVAEPQPQPPPPQPQQQEQPQQSSQPDQWQDAKQAVLLMMQRREENLAKLAAATPVWDGEGLSPSDRRWLHAQVRGAESAHREMHKEMFRSAPQAEFCRILAYQKLHPELQIDWEKVYNAGVTPRWHDW